MPYVSKKKEETNLPESRRALCIFDNFSGQVTDNVLQLLDSNHIDTVFVPANCTDQLQPLDLSVNKSVKDILREKFELWYSEQIFEQGVAVPIKFPLHTMKPLGAEWMKEVHCHMLTHPEIICHGFSAAGITDALG